METVKTTVEEKICTGCGACENICPVDAISMRPNYEGFIVPDIEFDKCVKCEKCVQVCPTLNVKHGNNLKPEVYAVRAGDEIRKVSSSGGLFTLLAEKIIAGGGVVYGAAFDKNMQLRHVAAETIQDLAPLRGSKYVQSDTSSIYRNVKMMLENGREVLFTGTPCQVAALKNYLRIDYTGLYTVDLVCHGVPSQKILDRYISEKFPGKIVVDINFRNKKYGWNSTFIDIFFEDGSQYSGNWKEKDVYEIIFQSNLGLRKSCSDCKFCDFPREGDLTIGDFWGINQFDSSQNDLKGTSMAFVNSERGRTLLMSVSKDAVVVKIECDVRNIDNRLKAKYAAHPEREYFFKLVSTMNINDAVKRISDNKHDIGLVGIYTVDNFGGALTYYALYKTLCDMGYSVLMIERPLSANHKPSPLTQIYCKPPYSQRDIAKIYPNKTAMLELNSICDKFVIGSDQLFNNYLYHQFGKWCTLDWVYDNKRKVAYAASFGHDHIWSAEDVRAEMSFYMKKFDSFSVREESGVKICKEEFDVSAEWVLDPVFLCDPVYYDELADNSKRSVKKNYIAAYILDLNAEKSQIISDVAKEFNKDTDIYTEMYCTQDDLNGFSLPVNLDGKIEDRLSSIRNSDMVIADSFHGICMAIIMKKNFIAISNAVRGKERFLSVLRLLDLEDRLVDNYRQFKDCINILMKPINYSAVYLRLDEERRRCSDWLKAALEDKTKKSLSTYDVLKKQIYEMSARINELTEKNSRLNRTLDMLARVSCLELYPINSLIEYFNMIQKNQENYIVAVAVKDTPGLPFSIEMSNAMALIGTKESLVNKHWYGYAALIDGGKIVGEKCEYNASVEINDVIDGLAFRIVSKPLKAGNSAVIKIDNLNYAINRRGINIVVFDKSKRCVCDSVCFDTHVKSMDCYR